MGRSFPGVDEGLENSVSVLKSDVLDTTFSAWFMQADGPNDIRTLGQLQPATNPNRFINFSCQYVSGGTSTLRTGDSTQNDGNTAVSVNGYALDEWSHGFCTNGGVSGTLVAMLNGDVLNIGQRNNSGSYDLLDSFDIGKRGGGGNDDTWLGDLAECAVWDVELDLNHGVALAEGYSPALVLPQLLLGYWPLANFIPGDETTVYNEYESSYPLTKVGSGTVSDSVHPGGIVYPFPMMSIMPAGAAPPVDKRGIILGNTTINAMNLGNTAINKAYIGSTLVFGTSPVVGVDTRLLENGVDTRFTEGGNTRVTE